MRVLIVSNAPWTKTGYGLQGAALAKRLQADGHTVAYMCNYGLEGGGVEWAGITCLPTGPEGGYADPIVHGHIRAFLPDLVFTIFDAWVLKGKPSLCLKHKPTSAPAGPAGCRSTTTP